MTKLEPEILAVRLIPTQDISSLLQEQCMVMRNNEGFHFVRIVSKCHIVICIFQLQDNKQYLEHMKTSKRSYSSVRSNACLTILHSKNKQNYHMVCDKRNSLLAPHVSE